MKKFVAILMIVALVMMTWTASAFASEELVYGFKSYKPGFFTVNEETGETEYHYYMILVDDLTMQDREVEVTERNGVIVIVNDPLTKSNRPWYQKVGAFLTFWNPDD